MKNIFYILLLLPTIIFAQYPSNSGHKITLGEQTTADGLIWRGVAATDTVRKPSIDTMAYMVLDTTTNIIWHYKKATSNAWLRLNLLPSDTASMLTNYWRSGRFSGVLPVANGGTNTSTAFTAGSVVFAGSGGTYTQANEDIRFITGDKRLVLGPNTIVSPETPAFNGVRFKSMGKIQIARSDEDTRFISIDNEGGEAKMNFKAPGAGYGSFKFTQSNNAETRTILHITGDGNFGVNEDVAANITQKLTVVGNGLFTQNLGVGGVTPTSRLHVKGVTNTSGESSLNVTNSSDASLLFVRNDGNVGIGTVSPDVKLHVQISNNTNLPIADFRNAITPAAGTDAYIRLRLNNDNYSLGHSASLNSFVIANASNLESNNRFIITSSGNIGIGTTSPTYKLDVNGTGIFRGSSATPITSINTGQRELGLFRTSLDGGFMTFQSSGANARGYIGNGGGISSAGETSFGIRSESDLILMSGGNNVRLTIASTGAATFSSSVTGNRYIINGSNGNAGQIIQQGDLLGTAGTNLLLQSNTGNAIGFLTNGGTTFNMFINTSGNVGIGTTSPEANDWNSSARVAHIYQNTTNGAIFKAESSNTKFLIVAGSGIAYLATTTNSPFAFYTNTTERMRITSGGEVNIGYVETDNGAYPLQVNGQIFATNATIATSDIKFKENITPLNKGLDIINKLKPVTFNFINDTKNNFSEYEEVGFIAQDVDRALSTETFAKSIVKASDDSDPNSTMGLATQNLIPILVKAIQEQNSLIKALEQRIINLENK
jgi:hypothetical protein